MSHYQNIGQKVVVAFSKTVKQKKSIFLKQENAFYINGDEKY
jgi:hypothetical protein